MKRSIVSICVFLVLIVLFTVSEMIYINNLANAIDEHTQDFHGVESCEELDNLFESRKFINRVFLRENVVEKFEVLIKELSIYAKKADDVEVDATLEKIKLFTSDLHEGRAY